MWTETRDKLHNRGDNPHYQGRGPADDPNMYNKFYGDMRPMNDDYLRPPVNNAALNMPPPMFHGSRSQAHFNRLMAECPRPDYVPGLNYSPMPEYHDPHYGVGGGNPIPYPEQYYDDMPRKQRGMDRASREARKNYNRSRSIPAAAYRTYQHMEQQQQYYEQFMQHGGYVNGPHVPPPEQMYDDNNGYDEHGRGGDNGENNPFVAGPGGTYYLESQGEYGGLPQASYGRINMQTIPFPRWNAPYLPNPQDFAGHDPHYPPPPPPHAYRPHYAPPPPQNYYQPPQPTQRTTETKVKFADATFHPNPKYVPTKPAPALPSQELPEPKVIPKPTPDPSEEQEKEYDSRDDMYMVLEPPPEKQVDPNRIVVNYPPDGNDDDGQKREPFVPPPLVDKATGLMGAELEASRQKEFDDELEERRRTLRNKKWVDGDEESIINLFERLNIHEPDAPLIRTNLYARSTRGCGDVKWVEAFMNRNRGNVYIPHHFKVLNIWSVDRPEDKMFRSELYNKCFLFHGVHRNNLYAYLKYGFNCKEAWASKKAVFQQGIYFHSCSTKAANFTYPEAYRWERKADRQLCKPVDGDTIYILLCHVALGHMVSAEYPVKSVVSIKRMWTEYDSIRCEGLCQCMGEMSVENGTIRVPMGPFSQIDEDDEDCPKEKQIKTHSIYDDICVHEPNQCRINYVCEVQYLEERPDEQS